MRRIMGGLSLGWQGRKRIQLYISSTYARCPWDWSVVGYLEVQQ
jgi:hypothetical protein